MCNQRFSKLKWYRSSSVVLYILTLFCWQVSSVGAQTTCGRIDRHYFPLVQDEVKEPEHLPRMVIVQCHSRQKSRETLVPNLPLSRWWKCLKSESWKKTWAFAQCQTNRVRGHVVRELSLFGSGNRRKIAHRLWIDHLYRPLRSS